MNNNLKTELQTYQRDGFGVVRGAVRGEQLQQLDHELTRLQEPEPCVQWETI